MMSLRVDSSIAFFIFAAALWAAWRRGPRVAVSLFALGVLFTVAVYLHHATDALPLSF
jgi:RsiW-degrading membrane proteinase PrsW (M82 family)